jgi:hypothetical protein
MPVSQSNARRWNVLEHALQVVDEGGRLALLGRAQGVADTRVGAADQRGGGRRRQVSRLVRLRDYHQPARNRGGLGVPIRECGQVTCDRLVRSWQRRRAALLG